jgi:hypothetical protein
MFSIRIAIVYEVKLMGLSFSLMEMYSSNDIYNHLDGFYNAYSRFICDNGTE